MDCNKINTNGNENDKHVGVSKIYFKLIQTRNITVGTNNKEVEMIFWIERMFHYI